MATITNQNIENFKKKDVSKHVLLFLKNRNIFLYFLTAFVFPVIIAKTVFEYYQYEITGIYNNVYFFKQLINIPISILMFSSVMLFVMSFTLILKISEENEISFSRTIKLMPIITKKAFFSVLLFSAVMVIFNNLFFIAPYIIIVFFPVAGIVTLYNNNSLNSDIVKYTKEYRKTKYGQKLTGKIILIIIVLFVTLGLIYLLFKGVIYVFNTAYPINLILKNIIGELFFVSGFLTVFFFINIHYTEKNFNISKEIHKKAIEVITITQRERKSNKKEYKRGNKKKSRFGKKKSEETNRFEKDQEYNRFEDIKF